MSTFLSLVIKEYFLMLCLNNLFIFSAVSLIFNVVLCEVLQLKSVCLR